MWWNPQQWAEVVERTPLVSIDLVVPGGVVRKGETLRVPKAWVRTMWC